MKQCSKCREFKNYIDFTKVKGGKDGYRPDCKSCCCQRTLQYYKTKKGLIIRLYQSQKQNSKKRGHKNPSYTLEDFKKWIINQENFEILFNNWKKSGYETKLSPSIDRKNDYKGYSFNNIQLITWEENNKKYQQGKKNGINNSNNKAIIGIHKETGERIEFHSMIEAERQTGILNGNISRCCSGYIKSAGNFIWKYKKNYV